MIPRPWLVFFGVILLSILLTQWVVPGLGAVEWYWPVTLVAAAIAGYATHRSTSPTGSGGGGGLFGRGEFLCDSCKYDHPDLCSRSERPNATRCPDYERRGG